MRILLFCIVFLLVLISCKKENQTQKPCRISNVIQRYQYRVTNQVDTIVLTIQYNERGNPTVMDFDKNETGKPDYYFTYDASNRLTQLATMYGASTEYLYKFYYESGSDLIAYDTMYHTMGDGLPYSHWVRNKYTYDAQGRISLLEVKSDFGASFLLPYGYNAAGNLILIQGHPNDASGYDSKKSIHSTHKIFQFLRRNYSANNPTTAISYNAEGLPLIYPNFLESQIGIQTPVDFFNMLATEIEYDCDY